MSMAWRTLLNISKPTVPRPYTVKELEDNHTWQPYPKTNPEITLNPRMIDDTGFSLYEIGADICSILLSGNPQDSPLPGHVILEPEEKLAKSKTIEHDLLTWQDEQPFSLPPMFTENLAAPSIAGPVIELQ